MIVNSTKELIVKRRVKSHNSKKGKKSVKRKANLCKQIDRKQMQITKGMSFSKQIDVAANSLFSRTKATTTKSHLENKNKYF